MAHAAGGRAGETPLVPFLKALFDRAPVRVSGTAVYMSITPDGVPHALLNNLEHNSVMHDRVLFVNVSNSAVPRVPPEHRLQVTALDDNCWRILVVYGFKDEIDLPAALRSCTRHGLQIDPSRVSYFLSHAVVVATGGKGMWLWRERLFATMSHNMANMAGFMKLPADRVIELGSRVEI